MRNKAKTRCKSAQKYHEQKENARRLALNCQQICTEMPQIYGTVADNKEFFTGLAKKYGLIREFKEKGFL